MANGNTPSTPVLPLSVAIIAFVNTVATSVGAFGFTLTEGQRVAISTVTNSIVILIVSVVAVIRARKNENEKWSHMNGNWDGKERRH